MTTVHHLVEVWGKATTVFHVLRW